MKIMKKTGAILCLVMVMLMMTSTLCFGTEAGLKINQQYPEDGATGTTIDNAGVKIWFNQDVEPKNDKVRKSNANAVKLVNAEGKELPTRVIYSPDEEGVMMVLVDTKKQLEGDMEYTMTIDETFQATSGDLLTEGDKVTFKTMNQKRTMTVNMLLMFVMMGGMMFFATKTTQHDQKKAKEASGKHDTVNPYKEAKRTGKSVAEIVAQDQKNKEKEAAAKAKRDAKRAKEKEEERREELNIHRVSGPRPISAAGGKYKMPKKETKKAQSNKGTTRPKNQSGKQKNKGKK